MLNYVHVFSLLYAFVDLKTNNQTNKTAICIRQI